MRVMANHTHHTYMPTQDLYHCDSLLGILLCDVPYENQSYVARYIWKMS